MFLVRDFKGQIPARDPRLLPEGYAQKAVNCDLDTGAIRPLKNMGSGAPQTWAFVSDVGADFVPANVSGVDRLLVSGISGYPQARQGGVSRRWGVVIPETIPTIAVVGEAEPGASVSDTVSYCYTFVTAWGEESAISGASMPVDVRPGQHVTLSNFDVPSYAASGNDITHIRIYRTASDEAGVAEFQQVMIRTSSPTGAAVWDVPAGSVPSSASEVYDSNDSGDSLNDRMGNIQMTEGWTPPPNDAHSGVEYTNGVYALLKGKRVFLSVSGYYYAFPADGLLDYSFELEFEGVGLGVYNQQLIVCTTAYPEIISGVDPQSATRYQLPYQQPCLSKKSIVSTPHGVCYASPDGLFIVNDTGGQVLTQALFSRAHWQAYPLESMVCAYHNNKVFCFFTGTNYGFAIDFSRDDVVFFEDIGAAVTGLFVDPEADLLHINTAEGWRTWSEGSGFLQGVYRSKIAGTPPSNFSCARLAGEGIDVNPVVVKIYGDGVEQYSHSANTPHPFRLPAGYRAREWFIELIFGGDVEIHAVVIANSMQELQSYV